MAQRAVGDNKRFTLLAKLGQGGMSDVHLAVAAGPHGFNKLVVLKRLREELVADRTLLRMFLAEARLAARLNHPNVVHTYEVTEESGYPVIVMEYLEGQPLSNIVAHALGAVPIELHLRVIAGVLEGLQHAHELADFDGRPLNLVHRDISPSNVIVTFDGQVKILDFGIAKAVGASAETRPGVVKGKVPYMAPEQMAGERVDRRADLYSVGVMLWEATAGRYLWKGVPDRAVMINVLEGRVSSIRDYAPWASPKLHAIVERALAAEPSARYQTASEMLHDLEAEIEALGGATQRELGAYVCEQFRDERAQTKAAIEEQLGAMSLLDGDDGSDGLIPLSLGGKPLAVPRIPPGARHAARDEETQMSTIADGARPLSTQPPPQGSRRNAAFAIAFVALVATGFVLWRSARHAEHPKERVLAVSATPSVTAALSSPSPSASLAEPASLVEVNISVTPAGARITWDDHPLTNPSSQLLPRDGSKHRVHVAAKGYKSHWIDVTLDRDARIELSLERVSGGTEAAPKMSVAPSPAKSAVSPSASAPARCDPPYHVDEHGIRRIKPECI